MGHGNSTFQSLSDDQKVAMLQHLKASYEKKIIEFDGLTKQDRINILRAKQTELKKRIETFKASFLFIKSNYCINCISSNLSYWQL